MSRDSLEAEPAGAPASSLLSGFLSDGKALLLRPSAHFPLMQQGSLGSVITPLLAQNLEPWKPGIAMGPSQKAGWRSGIPCPHDWDEITAHPHAGCGDGGWLTSTHPFCLPNMTQAGPWQGSVCPVSEPKFVSTMGVIQSAYENHPGVFKLYLHWDNLLAIHAWSMDYDGR